MDFLLLVCMDASAGFPPQEAATFGTDVNAWIDEMDNRGIRVHGSALAPVRDAKTIRVREGKGQVADEPFAETKEQIVGFDVLRCADLNEAIDVASRHPVARFGQVELRPLLD